MNSRDTTSSLRVDEETSAGLIGKSRVRRGGAYPAVYLNSSPEDACSAKLCLTTTAGNAAARKHLWRWRGARWHRLFTRGSKIRSTRSFEKLGERRSKFRPSQKNQESCLCAIWDDAWVWQNGGNSENRREISRDVRVVYERVNRLKQSFLS